MLMKYLTKRNIYLIVFLVSASAMGGSLYYSEIVGLEPCLLCWYQRIVMYPIVALSLVGIIRKSNELPYFALPLSVIGLVISTYHYSLQRIGTTADIATPCTLTGPSCTGIYLEYFGFITIPFMALLGFLFISFLLWFSLRLDRTV